MMMTSVGDDHNDNADNDRNANDDNDDVRNDDIMWMMYPDENAGKHEYDDDDKNVDDDKNADNNENKCRC